MRKEQAKIQIAIILIILVCLSIVQADHGPLKTCYECAKENRGKNNICSWGGTLSDDKVPCCKPGSTSLFCQPSKKNQCSAPYNEAKHTFMTFCPGITEANCGGKMEFISTADKQTFSYSGLRQVNGKWYKLDKNDICHYKIGNKPFTFKTGSKVNIKFNQVEEGVKLFINYGSDIRNASFSPGTINNETQIAVNGEFQIDGSENFVLVAIPEKENYKTTFEFEYWTVGEAYPWYEAAYYTMFANQKYGDELQIMVLACLGLCVLFCFCGICCCIKNCLNKNKVKDEGGNHNQLNDESELKDFQTKKNDMAGQESEINEMQLESVHGSEDDEGNQTHSGGLDSAGPSVKKQNAMMRDAEIKQAYSNPFKTKK